MKNRLVVQADSRRLSKEIRVSKDCKTKRDGFVPADIAKQIHQKQPRQKLKNDPKFVAAARELRDRYLEQFNNQQLVLPQGKYEVRRVIAEAEDTKERPIHILAA